jgi:hypothetical protein
MFVVLLRTVRDFALDWRSGALNSSKMQEGAGCCVPRVTALFFLLLGRGGGSGPIIGLPVSPVSGALNNPLLEPV